MYDSNYLQAEMDYRRQRIQDGIMGRRRWRQLKRQGLETTRR